MEFGMIKRFMQRSDGREIRDWNKMKKSYMNQLYQFPIKMVSGKKINPTVLKDADFKINQISKSLIDKTMPCILHIPV